MDDSSSEAKEEIPLRTDVGVDRQSVDGQFEENVGEYYFESDELALKGNADYFNLLRTVTLLEAQRMKAIKDLDRLAEVEKEALADPISFVKKLQGKEDLNFPELQSVAEIPYIDWEKYTRNFTLMSLLGHNHMTRKKIKGPKSDNGDLSMPSTSRCLPGNTSTEAKGDVDDNYSNGRTFLVRGRVLNMGKPQSFNQLWTVEEQKHLEQLLVKFPPEDVEARRWEKIAKALGNRTPQQVASRVQKYFIKLTKAGLPVPGRIPNMSTYTRRSGVHHRQHRHNRFLFQPSTFLASYEPPVFMSDVDEDLNRMSNHSPSSSVSGECSALSDGMSSTGENDIPLELQNTDEYRQLLVLQRLRRQRLSEKGSCIHKGFKCDLCGLEPIVGTRWHCISCPPSASVDLCENCIDSKYESGAHISNHPMEPIHKSQESASYVDGDYIQFLSDSYNYLDPNYMPAS